MGGKCAPNASLCSLCLASACFFILSLSFSVCCDGCGVRYSALQVCTPPTWQGVTGRGRERKRARTRSAALAALFALISSFLFCRSSSFLRMFSSRLLCKSDIPRKRATDAGKQEKRKL